MTTKVFLGGISPDTTSESIRDHFEKYGPVTDTVAMMKDGKPRGFGFVTFESVESVDAMFSDGEQNLDGRVIECKVATREGTMGDPAARNAGGYGGGYNGKGGGGGKGKDSYGGGGTPYYQFDSYGSDSKGGGGKGGKGGGGFKGGGGKGGGGGKDVGRTNKIFVGGLSSTTTNDMLADYFGVFGSLVDHVVMVDKATGKPKGFGFVQYEDPESVDAVLADYANHQIDGKWIEVKRAQPAEALSSPSGGGKFGGGGFYGGGPPPSSYASYGVVNPYNSYGPATTKGGGGYGKSRPQPYGKY